MEIRPAEPDPGDPAAPTGRDAGRPAEEKPVADGSGNDERVAFGLGNGERAQPAEDPVPDPSTFTPSPGRSAVLWRELAVYTVLRFALVVALTALLALFMPLIVALMFAIIVQLPLAWIVFARQRAAVNAALAAAGERRRAERARLQAALTGEEPPD